MSSRTPIRVVVLMGGPSVEREVSLATGRECAAALRDEGYDVVEVDAGRDIVERLCEIKPDVAFNALHGRWGEDGCMQGILEWMGIPYTHSGVLASSLAMDKQRAKAVYCKSRLPSPEGWLVSKEEILSSPPCLPPYVIKPNNEGSSVGVHIVANGRNAPVCDPDELPDMVLVERYVPGRELTVGVLGDEALTVTDIQTTEWYDYDAKYAPGGSTHVCPAKINDEVFETAMTYALKAHRALGCRGLSRTDFRWNEDDGAAGLFLLETNTQPGMTPTSLCPEQAMHCGMHFGALCRELVEDASCGR